MKYTIIILLLLVGLIVGCGESQSRQMIDAIEQKISGKSEVLSDRHNENKDDDTSEDAEKLVEQGAKCIEERKISAGVEKFERAAALGNVKAMLSLARLYEEGRLIEPDSKKAFSLWKDAAERNSPKAMACLAGYYKKGVGTEIDEEKAKYWLNKAVEAGYAPVILLLARDKYLAARYEEALSLLGLIKEGDECEFIEANILIGSIYMDGLGVEADPELGKSYYEKCIERNSMLAMRKLGIAYCKGKSLKRDYGKGVELIRKSLSGMAEDREICEILGYVYLDPEWTGFNLSDGIAYLEKANAAYDFLTKDSLYMLGMIYAFEDRGLLRFDRGVEFLRRAAKKGVGDAAYYLAVLYFNGDGVEKSMYKAADYVGDALLSANISPRNREAAKRLGQTIKKIRGY